MTNLGDRIDEQLLRHLEIMIEKNHEMRGLLETAMDAEESNGKTIVIDGLEYRCVTHYSGWIAAVKLLLGKDAADAQGE